MYHFELSDAQADKLEKWQAEQIEKKLSTTTLGERWVFCFIPTGLGTITSVIDQATNQEIDLTDWDNF
jgi:hypothetical protein